MSEFSYLCGKDRVLNSLRFNDVDAITIASIFDQPELTAI